MVQWLAAAGDVASAATALGGLLLVFIGAVSSGYGSYDATQQTAVRLRFQIRGCLALAGFLLALSSAVLAISGKLADQSCLVVWAVGCLAFAFLLVSAAAVVTVLDLWE